MERRHASILFKFKGGAAEESLQPDLHTDHLSLLCGMRLGLGGRLEDVPQETMAMAQAWTRPGRAEVMEEVKFWRC